MARMETEPERVAKVFQIAKTEIDFLKKAANELSELEAGDFEVTPLGLPGDVAGSTCFLYEGQSDLSPLMGVVFNAKRTLEHTGDMGAAMKSVEEYSEAQAKFQIVAQDLRRLE